MSYSDLHCHPFLRPFERTDADNNSPVMSNNPCDETSVWHLASEGGVISEAEHTLGFIGYTEADFTHVVANKGAFIVASLFAVENGFFELKKGIASAILQVMGLKSLLESLL